MSRLSNIIEEDLTRITSLDLPWEQLYGSSILISGANGFLPSYLVHTLLRINDLNLGKKIKLFALVRNEEKAKQRFSLYANRSDFRILLADITNPINFNEGLDYIIHAASQASPKYYGIDPVGTLSANTIGTYHLLQLGAAKKLKKFLYFSSSEVYGALANGNNIKESDYGVVDPMNIRSCYAESKRMGETMCVSFSAQYQIPVSIVRPFHTYGPGLSLDDGRVFADFISNVIRGQDIIMNSDGSAVRSFCYLSDATAGFLYVLLKGADKEAYNVGNPKASLAIKELAELLVNLYPEKEIKAVFKQDKENYLASSFSVLCPDINKIKKLGWEPSIGVLQGFKRAIESFLL
jgi:UDP-glucuronate decarboxylase